MWKIAFATNELTNSNVEQSVNQIDRFKGGEVHQVVPALGIVASTNLDLSQNFDNIKKERNMEQLVIM